MGDAPREDLIRMTSSARLEYRADGGDEDKGGTLYGYAAVFDEWADIDSWEGRFQERIRPGAFKNTLKTRSDSIKCLFNHGMDFQIGDKPLGKPKVMKEDGRGLYVEVPLDDTSYNKDIRALLASGALDGMSIRMSVIRDEWDKGDVEKGRVPQRSISEIKLHEFGPVTFPAYQATQAGVRAHAPAAFRAWQEAQREEQGAGERKTEEGEGQERRAVVVADGITIYDDDGAVLMRLTPSGDGSFERVPPETKSDDRGADDDESRDEQHNDGDEPPAPGDLPTPEARDEVAAPTESGHPVPAQPRRREPDGEGRTNRERRHLTLAYMDEWLANERARTDQYTERVEDYEAALGRASGDE